MKRLIYALSLLTLCVGLAMAQKDKKAKKKAIISSEQTEHDFGLIKEANGSVVHTFVIKNVGTAPLVLTRVIASCGCTTPEYSPEPVPPGASRKIFVKFNPAGRIGPFIKRIVIYSNGKDGAFILRIKGHVE